MKVVLDCKVLVSAARIEGACREVVEPADTVFGLCDPDDEVYLATAMAGAPL